MVEPVVSKPFNFSGSMIFGIHEMPEVVGSLSAMEQVNSRAIGDKRCGILTIRAFYPVAFAPPLSLED
jgi:hypothetical protein